MQPNRNITAVIVEDEPKSAKMLQMMLARYCPAVEVKAIADDIHDAHTAILQEDPELVFLDIELGDNTAFGLLRQFDALPFRVIFITAYDHYALMAIREQAIDYLLKPVQPAELIAAVNKVVTNLARERHGRELYELLKHAQARPHSPKVAVPVQGGLLFLEEDDILYCKADSNYTHLYQEREPRIVVSRSIKEFEKMLSHSFFRVHHSYIVNLNHITRYIQGRGGYVMMKNGAEIEVSARKREQFLKLFHH